ncbi:Putative AAA+ superfamily ATPase [Ignavibacterium album JCM 16511]|uniref:Putative AAA+ superfamily ATPase n=1 Tax=Ignavibacterium album (strain DSM 19864 / JCM 16511 / NBRC 101810 / Mat9-16) TaxID=945713 RepID=I0AHI2_IGNAJ|nr:ATP-binding protein [Ignavibacterium album]AFH48439.1 Putative AAA+ superfamily ATPase [Ignavibacterium album JCM 16511]
MIKRALQPIIESKLFKGKIIIIYGARQVGKTTLIKSIQQNFFDKSLYLNCDEPDIRDLLTDSTSSRLKSIIGNKELVLIDEAQRVKNIGITLKLFADEIKNVQVIATGSSSFELSNIINEPLTGRKYVFILTPISLKELTFSIGWLETNRLLEERIIYGMYPEIISKPDEKKTLIKEITRSYLFKDILSFEGIRKPEQIEKLLMILAAQIGNEVSYNELANTLNIDKDTVSKYIDILEKAFIIFRLNPFSRNLRTEISKMRKIYFYDTGIRNALISNFNLLDRRTDKGVLWENFLISERTKFNLISDNDVKTYFWRTSQQQEIDYIEEVNGKLFAYEFTFSDKQKKTISKTFSKNYKPEKEMIVNKNNYSEFLELL